MPGLTRLSLDEPFAVFSDVHGNLPGLEAILTDIEARQVPATICLGDLVGYGPFPNEVTALVHERGIPTLMGNYDQGIGFEMGDCGCVYATDEQRAEGAVSLAWTQEATSEATKAILRSLHEHFLIATPAGELLAVHGSPRRINEYLFEDRPDSAMQRMATEYPHRAILFGHTHVPYVRRIGDTSFVNVGSGGRPKDGDWRVCCAIVDPRGIAHGGGVEFVRLPYDFERLQRALAATPLITSFTGPRGQRQKKEPHGERDDHATAASGS
jgi:predicted phosphodiesterase